MPALPAGTALRFVSVVALLTSLGCSVSSLDADGKMCPCTAGWTCDTETNLCVLASSVPAPADGAQDGDDEAQGDRLPTTGGDRPKPVTVPEPGSDPGDDTGQPGPDTDPNPDDGPQDACPQDPERTTSPDQDGDGVLDCNDGCPLDPSLTQDSDADGDGVANCNDDCPQDPERTSDLDSDQDGVLDCNDGCPADPTLSTAPDVDGDGVLDCNDACPRDPSRVADMDSDLDGVLDCNDACPTDGSRSEDLDSDGDGVLNCNDACPDNPLSSADGDRDGDGVPDCNDGCPDGPDLAADSDSDGDGVPNCSDACPGDPALSTDTDTDLDGVLDCNDLCPRDPTRSTDVDSDGDGIHDCEDECPADPAGGTLGDWYPDCDGDGVYASVAVAACSSQEADAVYDCPQGGDPASWSPTVGSDCHEQDADNPCACDLHDRDGDGQCAPYASLQQAADLASGVHDFHLREGSFPLYVDADFGRGGWVLIGRGREGWSFDDGPQGDVSSIIGGLGGSNAFAPAHVSASVVQALMDNAGLDLTDVEVRLRRAAANDGSAYQDVVWRATQPGSWSWAFDTDRLAIEHLVLDSALGDGGADRTDTYDATVGAQSDHRRAFTWAWSEHGSLRGFAYGSSVNLGDSGSDSFLWQASAEGHPIPYTEVYVRTRSTARSCAQILDADPAAADGTYVIDPDGFVGAALPMAVECDMAGGGWTVLYLQDFEDGDPDGWQSPDGAASPMMDDPECQAYFSQMLGGFDLFGKNTVTQRTVDLRGIPHTEVSVDLDFVVFDSWDGESGIVRIDGVQTQFGSFEGLDANEDDCGREREDLGPQPVSVQAAHTSTTVTVEVSSTLDQRPIDESFGVDNVRISIR